MPRQPSFGRGGKAMPAGGRPKADFSALGKAIKRLFVYYPRMAPLTMACILFSAVVSSIPSLFIQNVIAVIERWYKTGDWAAARPEVFRRIDPHRVHGRLFPASWDINLFSVPQGRPDQGPGIRLFPDADVNEYGLCLPVPSGIQHVPCDPLPGGLRRSVRKRLPFQAHSGPERFFSEADFFFRPLCSHAAFSCQFRSLCIMHYECRIFLIHRFSSHSANTAPQVSPTGRADARPVSPKRRSSRIMEGI